MEYVSPHRASTLEEQILKHISAGIHTRKDLVAAIGVSRPVLGRALAPLIRAGYVQSISLNQTSRGRGRPSEYLKVTDNTVFAIGFSLGRSVSSAVMMDRQGEVLAASHFSGVGVGNGYLKILHDMVADLVSVANNVNLNLQFISKVCVALPIPNDMVKTAPHEFSHIISFINETWNVPVTIHNTIVAAGLAEARWGAGKVLASQLYIHVSGGVGSCFIVPTKDEVEIGFPGEIGHVTVLGNKIQCHCGKEGCLETLVSVPAICAQAGVDSLTSLAQAFHNRDSSAQLSLLNAADALGRICATVALSVSPKLIIFGGDLPQVLPEFVDLVREAILREKIPTSNKSWRIVPAMLTLDGSARGSVLSADIYNK